ncbi:hypothetical protein RRF57_005404 [Xylaria bambusicola]|uniref:Uncharacterized protein n=1 Tax=Xylaria bambusicola TaxID=326684 RepID=A0AAN7UXZ6_9PEZI
MAHNAWDCRVENQRQPMAALNCVRIPQGTRIETAQRLAPREDNLPGKSGLKAATPATSFLSMTFTAVRLGPPPPPNPR